jgi:hypothetical protein
MEETDNINYLYYLLLILEKIQYIIIKVILKSIRWKIIWKFLNIQIDHLVLIIQNLIKKKFSFYQKCLLMVNKINPKLL